MLKAIVSLNCLFCCAAALAVGSAPDGLSYSGETTWDPAAGILIFRSNGTMPDTKEGFFWAVPPEVKHIEIDAGVMVRGGFRVLSRNDANPLRIEGKDRQTSGIYGTDSEQWTTRNGVADRDKWKYGSVCVLGDALVYISNLTSANPRGYHLSGYAKKAILHVSQCRLIDTRKGDNNNSDGFIGAAGSTIADSFISTSDDAIKAYHDLTIKNVTIEQHRNGAALQFGWGGETGHATVKIQNLSITGVNEEQRYNMAPFTWEGGTEGAREVTITGLKVRFGGMLYDETVKGWRAAGLFRLNPKGCSFNLTAVDGDIGGLDPGIRNTRGVIKLNGRDL